MPKTLKLGVLSKLIKETQTALDDATKVEKLKKDGTTGAVVNQTNIDDAVAALKDAKQKLGRVYQQGVLGVKVSP